MDVQLTLFLKSLHNYSFLNYFAIFFASYLPYFLLAFFLFFIFYLDLKTRIYFIFFSLISLFLSFGIFKKLINLLINRPRPFFYLNFEPLIKIYNDLSFPSGHATIFFTLFFVLYFFNKKISFYYFIFTFLMTMARVYVGVHWFSDILGGFLVAFLSFFITKKIFDHYLNYSSSSLFLTK